MITRFGRGPLLLERFWTALRRDRAATPPAGLDPAIADLTFRLERDLQPRALEPSPGFEAQLERQLHEQAGTRPEERAWTGPAINPNAHRRAAGPRETTDTTEQRIMSRTADTAHEPVPIQQRRWAREALKLAAAAVIFITVGAILALTLRDDDDTPAVGGPGPTPTPVVAPSPTATAASQAATPTDAPRPSAPATERVPAPIVMGTPAANLPLAGQMSARIPVGVAPSAITAGHGAIWVYNDLDGTVARIDPATNAVVATIPIATPLDPALPPADLLGLRQARPDLVVDATSVWAIKPEEQAIVRIDPQTNAVVATIPLEAKATSIAVDGSSLWVALFITDSVARIDTTTGAVVATIRNVTRPAAIAIAQDAVWVTNYNSNAVTRIDPMTNRVVAQVSVIWPSAPFGDPAVIDPVCGLCTLEVLANEHGVWVSLPHTGIARIDPATNRLAAVIPVGIEPRSLVSDARGVWVGHLSTAGVLLIDPETNQVVAAVPATEVPNQAAWIVLWENTLWAARIPSNDVARIDLQSE
jgi:YVTN family beta-propeller protein